MRSGLYLPNQGPFADAGLLADLARDAERAGWEGLFIWDELMPVYEHAMGRPKVDADPGDWLAAADAIVALTAIAAATERIRFGALVTPVARLRPEVFAHQTATLDRFSGGRLIVGVGLGSPDSQFAAFGYHTDVRTRAAQVDEFLALLVELWSGAPVDFDGAYFKASGVTLTPTPVQQPRIPVWIGADSSRRAPRRRAARWDGYAPASQQWPTGVISPAEYREALEEIGSLRAGSGPYDAVVIGNADATVPSAADLEEYEEVGVTWHLVQALTADQARERIRRGPPSS